MPKPSNQFARYTRATDDIKPRIIAASQGEVGSGKTTWWLGAPGPIIVQTLDQGLEGVVEPFAREKEIYIANYDMGIEPGSDFTHDMAVQARDKFIEDFEHGVGTGARTIIWDRESDMWPLFTFAEFGTPDAFGAAPAKDWDKLKGRIRRLIAIAKAHDLNLGIIRGMKNEWAPAVNPKTGKKTAAATGNRVPSGMDEIDALVHITIEHVREDGKFRLKVGKSRGPGGHDVQDKTLTGVSFADFAEMVFPETSAEDWQ